MNRFTQVLLAMMAVVLSAPVVVVLAVAVRARLGSPVLFMQVRSGRGQRPFAMRKFRSMTNETDSDGQLLPDAERLTIFGVRLRRSRMDELPELINVIRGEMALVGPRPLPPDHPIVAGRFGPERGLCRPGLTGLAQVSGNTLLSDEEKLALDLEYVRTRSARLDLEILLRTVDVVLFGEKLVAR